eukprot:gnl/TRDRNA2_/TRDRNA2_135882_c0_seq1.p1 gnl/TRDRNA2_/TRDRNA2_135882_c0~~gnl/TRDRNA2_/TRDRNA2_135882_c0_seq1.p1  ORF type:complete len:338 (-),score=37.81 gnl/TRDRNA2_/TRDRNA2_135882_c0_seq1:25-1014(-)
MVAFQLLYPVVMGSEFQVGILAPMGAFPILLFLFFLLRRSRIIPYLEARNKDQERIIERLQLLVANVRLITDYNQRGVFVDSFEDSVSQYNRSNAAAFRVQENDIRFPKWLTVLFSGGYIIFGGMQVVREKPGWTIGVFLMQMKILSRFGGACGEIYQLCVQMRLVIPHLMHIVSLLNTPIDTPKRGALARYRIDKTVNMRDALRKRLASKGKTKSVLSALDLMPISVGNLEFMHGKQFLRFKNHIEVLQGQLVAVVGKHGEGKSTFLQILGSVILPVLARKSEFFVPSHLRVLHVSLEKYFAPGSLLENLNFGAARLTGEVLCARQPS